MGEKAEEVLESVAVPVQLDNREQLLQSASTSLNSKVVSQSSAMLAPIAVDAVLKVIDPKTATNVDLNDVRIVKKLLGTIEDSELVDGLVLTQKVSNAAGGPRRMKDAKIGLIQFCLSAPRPTWRATSRCATTPRWTDCSARSGPSSPRW